MTITYEAIASHTLVSDQTQVTFNPIASTWTDLVLVKTGGQSSGNMTMRFNSDSGTNYSGTQVFGTGSGSGSSDRYSSQGTMYINYSNATGNSVTTIMNIMNYANTTTNKTVLLRNNDSAFYVGAYVHLWRSTAAITRIDLFGSPNLLSGSTFTLYGIKAE